MAAANCRRIRRTSGGGVGGRGGASGVDEEPCPPISSSPTLASMFRSGTMGLPWSSSAAGVGDGSSGMGPYPGGKKCAGCSSDGVGDGSRGGVPVRAGHGWCCRQYGGSGGGACHGSISSSTRNGADGPATSHSIGGMEKAVGGVAGPVSLAAAGAEGPARCTRWLPWRASPRRRFFLAKKRRRGPLVTPSP